MFTIDAHLDLSMNAMEWNRDLQKEIAEIRERESGKSDKPDRGKGVVCFPELRRGNVGLVVATQIARYVASNNPLPGWHSPAQAWAHTQGQLAWYRAMEHAGELVQIKDRGTLDEHVARWMGGKDTATLPIGYILSLEGADSIGKPEDLVAAYQHGLRALGPAHYGPGRYAQGTNATGGIGAPGIQLLREMERLNIILDATHLCDDSFWEAMDHFSGPVWASHQNCRALVDHNRQFDDRQLKELIQRGAVIGAVMDAWMIVPNWERGVSTPASTNCSLERLVDHMDHICQLAGNADHIGIGSDLDGGFGLEQTPIEIETVADIQKIPQILSNRGYSSEDIRKIMHGNWLRFLRNVWK